MSAETHGDIILPPGLYLPLPEEDTEQYRVENFNHKYHDYERVVDFGIFATALIVLQSPETGRIDFKPSRREVEDLYAAGYGINRNIITKHYGGHARLQEALGFYTHRSRPGKEEILERMRWMAEHALPRDPEYDPAKATVYSAVKWACNRSLLPNEEVVAAAFGGDMYEARSIFGVERFSVKREYAKQDLYRFGARIIAEHGRPLIEDEINQHYKDEFRGFPRNLIRAYFGSLRNFWAEFGYYPNVHGITASEVLDMGVRQLIADPDASLSENYIDALSAQKRFVSERAIRNRFGSLVTYQQKVQETYEEYKRVKIELAEIGVSEEVLRLAARKFSSDAGSFGQWRRHSATLAKLSADTPAARYVRSLLDSGLDLANQQIYELQKEDLLEQIDKLRLGSVMAKRFVLSLVPCIDPDEWLPPPPPRLPRREYTFRTRKP